MAIADAHGCAYGSMSGLARIANIELDEIDEAFRVLMSPDSDSSDSMRAPDHEGRRIERIPGGFRLLNYEYYRSICSEEDRREQNRLAQQRFRDKTKSQDTSPLFTPSAAVSIPSAAVSIPSASVSIPSAAVSSDQAISAKSAQAEAEAEAEAEAVNQHQDQKRHKFQKPTVGQVRAYISEIKSSVDAEAFVNFYESKGWNISARGPMKDWRAAVRTWDRRETVRARPRGAGALNNSGLDANRKARERLGK